MAKHRELIGNYTRIVDELSLSGYVVKPEHLLRLDGTIGACDLFKDDDPHPQITYHAFMKDGGVFQFENLNDLVNYPNTHPELIEGVRISCQGKNNKKLEIVFGDTGEITIDVCGPPLIADMVAHSVNRQLRGLNQEYSWFVEGFILDSRLRRFASIILIGTIGMLIYRLGMYLYALSVGVNINPELIQTGMTYYQKVESAIHSQEIARKLDVLLLGHLRGFTNVTDYLRDTRTFIIGALLAILILGVGMCISRHLRQYFPRSFFALGHQEEVLVRMEKKRELWIASII